MGKRSKYENANRYEYTFLNNLNNTFIDIPRGGGVYFSVGYYKPTTIFNGTETAADLNSANSNPVTVTAERESSCTVSTGTTYTYSFTGDEQTFDIPCTGYYKLEVWGAQGYSNTDAGASGGKGGYSYVNYKSRKNRTIYVYVGGGGNSTGLGYNGGGNEGDS